jgi:putative transposase
MKKSRFSEEQMIGFLKQAERGMSVEDLCRRGVSVKRGLATGEPDTAGQRQAKRIGCVISRTENERLEK